MAAEEASEEETSAQEKCIKQLALNVVKNVKFHSNLQKASQFIAENATQSEHLEDSNSKKSISFLGCPEMSSFLA